MGDVKIIIITGEVLENFIAKNDLCFMNDKSQTYLHPATGHFSSLGLFLCHPSLLLDYDWSVCTPGKLSQVPPRRYRLNGCDRYPELPVMVKN